MRYNAFWKRCPILLLCFVIVLKYNTGKFIIYYEWMPKLFLTICKCINGEGKTFSFFESLRG